MIRAAYTAVLDHLPRGHTLAEADWLRRHRVLMWLLALHVPGLAAFGIFLARPPLTVLWVCAVPAACLALGKLLTPYRRAAAVSVTAGLVFSSGALVGLTQGSIEAHFHFFIIIGFIALYQDWVPFIFNVVFTVLSHGIGSIWSSSLIFNHPAAQANPWLWSLIHGVAVLFACVGMMIFWRITEDQQQQKEEMARRLAEMEIGRKQFTSDMLLNLARRNQSMLHRQLDIINQLEESERDPDALAELFKLDHLATRVRRNAESLLVLSGEQPPRMWSEPVAFRDIVRAAIAETEDMDRVVFHLDDLTSVKGNTVTDLTHLLAELIENAVRFSPPDTVVTIRSRANRADPGANVLTIEDWGVGMPAAEMDDANAILANPPEVDISLSQRLGIHVVARLAARHRVEVALTPTPGSGVTAVVSLPSNVFVSFDLGSGPLPRQPLPRPRPGIGRQAQGARSLSSAPTELLERQLPSLDGPPGYSRGASEPALAVLDDWTGWWASRPQRRLPQRTAEPVEMPAQRAQPEAPVSRLDLRRRVPQASLAPELRNGGPEFDGQPRPPAMTADAVDALSRYQASRRAAKATFDEDQA